MKRIKIGIVLITMSGLLLGTTSVASAKTASAVHHSKVSQTSNKSTHHQSKSQIPKKIVHKMIKSH